MNIPIILISSLDNEYTRNTSKELGADDFISKPFSIADIAYKIKIHSPDLPN